MMRKMVEYFTMLLLPEMFRVIPEEIFYHLVGNSAAPEKQANGNLKGKENKAAIGITIQNVAHSQYNKYK